VEGAQPAALTDPASALAVKHPAMNRLPKGGKMSEQMQEVQTLLKANATPETAIDALGNSSLVWEVMPLALFFFERYGGTFGTAVVEAANATGRGGGDTDSIAAVCGALCGAKHGTTAIPAHLLNGVEDSANIMSLADNFFCLARSHSFS
jgi:ADP-ribosylglycohydrolase